MRKTILLDTGWKFVKTASDVEAAVNSCGEDISLPHTWNAVDGQDGGNDYYRGTCWYTRKLEVPARKDDQEVWLEFNGAAMTAQVWLNGELLARHEGGYSTFRVNITEHLLEENVLAVSVDNSDNDSVYPQKADFTFYGGLYREVNLLIVPKAHFALGYAGGPGMKVTTAVKLSSGESCGCDGNDGNKLQFGGYNESDQELKPGSARITVEAWTEGPAESVEFTIDGQSKRGAVTDGYAKAAFIIENVHLWDGTNDPYLYTAQAKLDSGDEISTRFGCRVIRFDPQEGFFLNGRSYPLRGVSRHQDRAGAGSALTPEMHREDMEIIKEIGANTLRLAHYQHSQYFYDLCDEAGMIVWAEIPYITLHMENGVENTLSQMKELIIQNYNHPSIVCWGLSNEITASGGVTESLMENHKKLNDLCHSLDFTRPTTMAHVFMLETDSPLLAIPDIGSYNLYFGWYLGELSQNDSFFDAYHQTYPDRCIGFSEYGADANPAFQSAQPERGDYTESYQCVYHEHILDMIEKRPYLWATHVWNLFDFAADGRDEGGKNGVNQKGLVTMDRQLKKDAFYLYKAHWSSDPFVHICGRRYADRAEETTEIKVYSNQPQVTLYVDGKLVETQNGNYIFRFQVPISGEHCVEAKAGQTEGGMETTSIETTSIETTSIETTGMKTTSKETASIETTGMKMADKVMMDEIRIRKVDKPNPEYCFIQDGGIVNWFDKEDFKEGYFSIKDTLAVLQSHPQTDAIVGQMMAGAAASRGDVAESVKDNPNLLKMMGSMTLESMLKQAQDAVTPEQIRGLNSALQQIKKPE
ncbi:MAG: beta galactosidase jelly roll domain-containing protein [Faecalicatena sp.]|uniref:glycoside hydrolase family 2 protein n=1 Tax=Faecalicatena sp. TaxID=2005360 RepID=UPI00258AF42E|nr:glycoside hydrolase family 2 TIM barrel-domain containing protein [Faecalicatena sp.]MCI6465532.1 beta galactosidase jelly roll domain-containing protein [Faecalicatena sp.]MDY5617364.1 glycoside hydrolase family 2 TIM barrel-domain containing protein [Lachnospiraceae bacterium]